MRSDIRIINQINNYSHILLLNLNIYQSISLSRTRMNYSRIPQFFIFIAITIFDYTQHVSFLFHSTSHIMHRCTRIIDLCNRNCSNTQYDISQVKIASPQLYQLQVLLGSLCNLHMTKEYDHYIVRIDYCRSWCLTVQSCLSKGF